MTVEHENLSKAGLTLQYLWPLGRDPSKWAILGKAAACRTRPWPAGRKETTSKCWPVHLKNPVILINRLSLFKNTKFKIFRLAVGQMSPHDWLQWSSLTQTLNWKKGRNTQGNNKCCQNLQENSNFHLPPTFVSSSLFLHIHSSFKAVLYRASQTFPVLQAETEITAEVDKLSKRDRFWTWC